MLLHFGKRSRGFPSVRKHVPSARVGHKLRAVVNEGSPVAIAGMGWNGVQSGGGNRAGET